jgi:arylformamidase
MAIQDPDSSRVKGPLVWRDMDQWALDDAYDHTRYAPNREHVLGRYQIHSVTAREILGEPERHAYGPSAAERLDLFRATQGTAGTGAPVQIFVHGGAWRGTTASTYAFLAEMLVRAGAHLVILDFATVDDLDGDLTPMVEQVRRAVAWVSQHAHELGADPERIYLSAHSSGAHLGGCVVTTDWPARDLPADILKGAILTSGMYDLQPVRLSKRSAYLRFTDELEEALSPIRHLDTLTTPLILSYGGCETPEFQRQSVDYCRAIQEANKPATLLVGEGYNHFEILETLGNPYGLLGRAALAQMGLAPPPAHADREAS